MSITHTKKLSLLLVFVLTANILHSQDSTYKVHYPQKKFVAIEGVIEEKPILGSMNIGYKNFESKIGFQWCLNITIALQEKGTQNNGLPTKSESVIAYKCETDLLENIKKISKMHYIGHFFHNGYLEIYAYIDSREAVYELLQKETAKKKLTRQLAFQITRDSNWEKVQPFLENYQ